MISWKDFEGFFSSISRLIVLTQSCRVSVDQIPVDFPLIAYESKSMWTKTNRLNPSDLGRIIKVHCGHVKVREGPIGASSKMSGGQTAR